MRERYLADTSAWHWSMCVAERWLHIVEDGEVATCSVVEMEYLWCSRSKKNLIDSYMERRSMSVAPMGQDESTRAVEVMMELGKKDKMGHRSVKMADLLIAACAERSGLIILHYDSDFDRIAGVTGQSTEWLAKKGSLKR